jgi:DNA-binding HxlR family transcriptional regulator
MVTRKQQHTLLESNCPIAKTAHLVGDATMLLIVRDLFSGPKRFKDFSASLAGVSTRTLTNKLHVLVTHGIVLRTEFVGKPPKVEYTLTKKGEGLHEITEAMRQYGTKYLQ